MHAHAFAVSPARPMRVAVCLAGAVRTMPHWEVRNGINFRLLQALRDMPDVERVVLFLHLKREDQVAKGGQRRVPTANNSVLHDVLSALDPAVVEYGDDVHVQEKTRCPVNINLTGVVGHFESALNQMFMSHRCTEMVARYEHRLGSPFTHVVRSRPDLQWTRNVSSPTAWPVQGARYHDWCFLLPRHLLSTILERPYQLVEECREEVAQNFEVDAGLWMYRILDHVQREARVTRPLLYYQMGYNHLSHTLTRDGVDTLSEPEASNLFPIKIVRHRSQLPIHSARHTNTRLETHASSIGEHGAASVVASTKTVFDLMSELSTRVPSIAELAPDKSWIEVVRFSTSGCLSRPGLLPSWSKIIDACGVRGGEMRFSEGLSVGWPMDCGSGYAGVDATAVACPCNSTAPMLRNYGCWFYRSHGSGVAINVGRSLRARTRAGVAKRLGLPCGRPPLCNTGFTEQDKLWCTRARALGYDTIQVAKSHIDSFSEVIHCAGGCATQPVAGACPPVPLRTAAGGACACSDAIDILNCGPDAPPMSAAGNSCRCSDADFWTGCSQRIISAWGKKHGSSRASGGADAAATVARTVDDVEKA